MEEPATEGAVLSVPAASLLLGTGGHLRLAERKLEAGAT
jgi:hypothetical protein